MPDRPNVLLITLDQFRGDALSSAGHPVVRTPALDALATDGVRFARHYSQCAPCAPGRASLYTGMYQFNHRVVTNGTPLAARFDNVAWLARRAGYAPALFGYSDSGLDPADATGPDDPRLSTYEGTLPGFDHVLPLAESADAWVAWLAAQGVDTTGGAIPLLISEKTRPQQLSISRFMTDNVTTWIDRQHGPWFAHVSHLRPHPPYSAAGDFGTMYDPTALPDPVPMAAEGERHPVHEWLRSMPWSSMPVDAERFRRWQAQYYGMISEVDHEVGRLCDWLRTAGLWDETVIIVTSDHGEQMGDQGLMGKVGFFESSFHIPCIVRDPARPAAHGSVVDVFTENVDIVPTIAELIGEPTPAQCDGVSLMPWLAGESPTAWRTAAFYEYDWRDSFLRLGATERELATCQLAVRRSATDAYVHFGDGSWRMFDLADDPTWRTSVNDSAHVLDAAHAMLSLRARQTDRTMTGLLLTEGGFGRWPTHAGAAVRP